MSLAHFRYRLPALLLAHFLLLPGAAAPAEAPGLRWPLDLPARWLTSNFMEYRGGRFHAGIDLKTREAEGFPAYAVSEGWIARVRATPGGYGRAVYLQDATGRTWVYAHLARFNDRIAARVAAARARDGVYRVELEFAAGELPVARGDVLGLTGQSGTPGPHLHFEVRDAAGRPVDPLAAGFAVRDTIAPIIRHLRALPAAPGARLGGAPVARRLPVAGQPWADGRAPALTVSGPVAFSALVVEGTDPAGHRLEPWLLELSLDGVPVYRRANESFDFTENAQQRLEWLECGDLREQWLHRDPAVTVAGREGGAWFRGDRGGGLAPGRHALELVATDRAGNRATVAWDLEVLPPGDAPTGPEAAWKPEPVEIVVDRNQHGHMVLTPLFDVVPEGVADGSVLRLEPGGGSPVLAPVTVVRAPAVLDTAQCAQAARQGLVPDGEAVRWVSAAWPVDGTPGLDLPGGRVGADLYRWDGSVWTAAGPVLAPAAAGGLPRYALARPGLHAALRDTAPPVIAGETLVASPHPGFDAPIPGLTPPRWSIVPVGLRDAGAGVDPGSIAARWDGRLLVVEPDLVRDRVLVEIPDSTRAGDHVLELEARDSAGHRTARSLRVRCGPAAEAP